MSKSKVVPTPVMATSPGTGTRTRDTININTGDNEGFGQLLVPTSGLNIVGSSTPSKQFLNAKCDCTTTPGQCCWTAQVISERHQNEPQTIGPYCSSAKNCDEVKAKFLQGNTGLGLNFDSYLGRVTVA